MEMNEKMSTTAVSLNNLPDAELSGEINRSIGHSAKFALMLAMLQPDVLARPHFDNSESDAENVLPELLVESHYPQPPLSTSEDDIRILLTTSSILQSNPQDALLWQTMHPEPLSLFNDAKRLADDVVYNSSYHTQQQLKSPAPSELETDATGLYDILESLPEL